MVQLTVKFIRKLLYDYCILILIFFWSCTENIPVQPPQKTEPEISGLIAPSVLYNRSSRKHKISVKVEDPQGIEDIKEVRYKITRTESNTLITEGELVDDGTQGDIIPRDGVFTTQIDGRFAQNDSGDYTLSVFAIDTSNNTSNILTVPIKVLSGTENLPPVIVHTLVPTTVPVDSSFDFMIAVEVSDNEGLSDILQVLFQFFPPAFPNPTVEGELFDNGILGDEMANDGVYSNLLSSNLINEASDYFIRFQAEDKAGNRSQAEVVIIRGIFKTNDAPIISNLVAPDTVAINPTQDTKILMTIDVMDPQGLADIDYVQFRSFLPNGQEAQNSPFQMADNGDTQNSGDMVAGDGTYSIVIILPSSGVTPGDFRFVFQAKDKSNALSNIIEHILTVIE